MLVVASPADSLSGGGASSSSSASEVTGRSAQKGGRVRESVGGVGVRSGWGVGAALEGE